MEASALLRPISRSSTRPSLLQQSNGIWTNESLTISFPFSDMVGMPPTQSHARDLSLVDRDANQPS